MSKSVPHPTMCGVTAITPERVYITPHTALRKSISHYTVFTPQSGTGPTSLTIVPDASGSIVCRLAAESPQSVETWFWGPSSRAVVVENNSQKYPLYIMVEFLPCGAHRLLGIPIHELHNAMIPLPTLDMSLHRSLVAIMEGLATHAHGVASVGALLDTIFLPFFAQREDALLALHVVSEVRRSNGTLRVSDIARQLGCSSRQITRIMSECLGMPTKLLARIIRINAACRCMASPSLSLTELAHSLCYHDQSHFVHDFRDICGVTPGEYHLRMSHFYNEELKLGANIPLK